MVWLWEKTQRYLHVMVKFAHAIGGAVFVAVSIATVIGAGIAFLNADVLEYLTWAAYPKRALAIAAFFVALTIVATAFVFFYLYLYKRTKRRLKSKESKLNRYKSSEEYFRYLSRENAYCDKKLFDRLFMNGVGGGGVTTENIALAGEDTEDNIKTVVDTVSKIMTGFTGHTNCCSIEVLKSDGDMRDLGKCYTIPYVRCSRSRTEREALDSKKTMLRENSSYKHVLIEGHNIYSCDDLQNEKAYKNTQDGWEQEFNATIVCGIPSLAKGEGEFSNLGILIIDNMNGGLHNDTARHYARETSYRLAVMMYRLAKLTSTLSHRPEGRGQ